MTLEHGSRVRGARRKTRTEGSLCQSLPPSSLLHFPPASDSAQTARSPSTAPAQSLWREIHRGERKMSRWADLPSHKGFGRPLVDSLSTQTKTPNTVYDWLLETLQLVKGIQTLWCQSQLEVNYTLHRDTWPHVQQDYLLVDGTECNSIHLLT